MAGGLRRMRDKRREERELEADARSKAKPTVDVAKAAEKTAAEKARRTELRNAEAREARTATRPRLAAPERPSSESGNIPAVAPTTEIIN